MPKREKGILGVPKDARNQMLFSFNVRQGEEWASDDSDPDYEPQEMKKSQVKPKSPKTRRRRKRTRSSENEKGSDSNEEEETKKKKVSKNGKKQSAAQNTARTEMGIFPCTDARYQNVWGERIPPEILMKIFQYVIKKEGNAIPFLLRAPKVCRLWWEVSHSNVLWEVVDLSYGWIKTTDETLRYLCPDRLQCLKQINLKDWKKLTDSGLQAISDNCPELENIKLSGCERIKPAGIKALADRCPNLNTIDLSATSQDVVKNQTLKYLIEKVGGRLQDLTLGSQFIQGFSSTVNSISEYCHNLTSLDVSNAKFTTEFSLNIEKFQHGCPKLRILRFGNSRLRASEASSQKKAESPGFPDLQELRLATGPEGSLLNGGIGIDDSFLQRILKTSTDLKLLDLRCCCNVTSEGLQSLPITGLQYLFISQCTMAKYQVIQFIVQKWQRSLVELDLSWNIYPGASFDIAMTRMAGNPQESKLKSLNLSGTTITHKTVRSILEGCPQLIRINLQSCRGLPRGMKKDYTGDMLDKLRTEITQLDDGEPWIGQL